MCTIIDKRATKIEKKKLKKTGKSHAWKVVRVVKDEWRAPYYASRYNKVGMNKANGPLRTYWDEIHGGAFHCFLTRKLARTLIIAQLKRDLKSGWFDEEMLSRKYKVVKVIFNAKDFVCIGRQRAIDKQAWDLPQGNESICITKFKFAEK